MFFSPLSFCFKWFMSVCFQSSCLSGTMQPGPHRFFFLFNEGKGSDLSNASQIAVVNGTRKHRHRCFPLITEADFDCLFENTFQTRVMITISYCYNFSPHLLSLSFSFPFPSSRQCILRRRKELGANVRPVRA